jgi:hypothetical protein
MNADVLAIRLSGLLESAAEYVAKFDESRRHDPDNDEVGDQFAYGVATGIYSAVTAMVASVPNEFISFSRWVELGCPTDPSVIVGAAHGKKGGNE